MFILLHSYLLRFYIVYLEARLKQLEIKVLAILINFLHVFFRKTCFYHFVKLHALLGHQLE
jgi:hypothetical protein